MLRINYKILSCLAPGMVLLSCTSEKEERSKQPNFLVITCEDISPMLGCNGDTISHSPVLDKLAEEGVLFTNVFSVSGVCAPSRAALITGMYPSSIGAGNMRTNRKNLPDGIPPYEAVPPPEVKCFSEYLRAAGYYCTNNVKTDYQFKNPVTAWDDCSTSATWRNRQAGMPFFSIFNLMTTHESQVWDRANDPVAIPPEKVNVPPYYPDTKIVRRDIARVYSNITVMDREVRELIDMLKEDGLMEETIIIFYSDHGGPLPRQKREIYDSGLKVPMIIRFPDKEFAGAHFDDLVSFIDIPATILSMAGVKIPDYMQGQAFWGKQKTEPRTYIYAARDRMDGEYDIRRAVRDKQFKYIKNYRPEVGCYMDIEFRKKGLDIMKELLRLKDAGELNKDQMYWFRTKKEPEELYDIQNDPHELNNLASDPAYEKELLRLREVHEKWMKDIGDKGLMTEKELVWSMWPDGIQPETADPVIKAENNMLEISCATEGASIGYQMNGEIGGKHWALYHQPLKAAGIDSLRAVAIRIGFKESERSLFYKH